MTVLVVAALVVLAFATSRGAFVSAVPVTFVAERAGLGLARGNDVSLNGVRVGAVTSIARSADGVTIEARILKDFVNSIPANATATIGASTFFGPQGVVLQVPARSSNSHVVAGSQLAVTDVGEEFNTVFSHLMNVLEAVDPGRLNSSLSTIAQALDGRGEQVGETASGADRIAERLNREVPTLQADMSIGADVAEQYADQAPALLKLMRRMTTVAEIIVDEQHNLDSTATSLSDLSDEAAIALQRVGPPLIVAARDVRPAVDTLARMSPTIPCTLRGLNFGKGLAEAVVGSVYAAIQVRASFLPGQSIYQLPRDKQRLISGQGPDCFGLPSDTDGPWPQLPAPRYLFDDGTQHVWNGKDDSVQIDPQQNLRDLLFGVADLAGAGE